MERELLAIWLAGLQVRSFVAPGKSSLRSLRRKTLSQAQKGQAGAGREARAPAEIVMGEDRRLARRY